MAELDTKFNYVFFVSDPFVAQMYHELSSYDNVIICRNGMLKSRGLLNKLHKIHWSYKLNRKIKLPFKRVWFSDMAKPKFPKERPVCYVFFGGQYCINDYGLIDYIRKQNPENKVVAYFLDLVRHKNIKDFDELKKKCDLLVSYDRDESLEHGFSYFDKGVYSRLAETTHPAEFEYDLYFVGYAKDRLDRLIQIHSYLSQRGVRCQFKLAGLAPEIVLNGEGLVRMDKPLAYEDVVKDIQKTRCILELSQKNATGQTMRTCEAICYQRKLLTDRMLQSTDHPSQFKSFTEPESIDVMFLTSPLAYEEFTNETSLSPVSFIDFLETLLGEKR